MAILAFAAVAIPTFVRGRVGGTALSYAALVFGLVILIVGEALQLVSGLFPTAEDTWLVSTHLPTYGGGYLLALLGFLSLMHDLKAAQTAASQAAAQDRCRAEAAHLQEAKLQANLTETKAAQDAIRCQRDFTQGIIEANELFIVGLSLPDGCVTMFNHGAERITGHRREEVLGREYAEALLPEDDRARVRQVLADGYAGRLPLAGQREHAILTKSGERHLIAWTYTASCDEAGRLCHVVGFGHDVTSERQTQVSLEQAKRDLERANAELEHLATTDGLTGLINRRQAEILFEQILAAARRHLAPASVVMVDLDHFKSINDTYGHEAGDAVLKLVAEQFRARVRASDVVARYGGEEFLLVLSETDLDAAVRVAETLRRRIQDTPFAAGDRRVHLSASFGVTALNLVRGASADEIIHMADEAMYCAKGLGGNRVVTWNSLREGKAGPNLAASDEVQVLQKRVEALTRHNREQFLANMYQLADSIEARNEYTEGHSRHVAEYAVTIAREMGLPLDVVEALRRAALLHDIGKAAIPDEVLWKHEALSKDDWALVCQHPVISVKVLERIQFLQREAFLIRHHHERPDGRGYPDGLAGAAIPTEARILAVADALDAMTRARPYRPALTLAEALVQLESGTPRQFDAAAVAAAVAVAGKCGGWPLGRREPAGAVAGGLAN